MPEILPIFALDAFAPEAAFGIADAAIAPEIADVGIAAGAETAAAVAPEVADVGIASGAADAFGAGAADLSGGLVGTDAGLSTGSIGAGLGPEATTSFGAVTPEVGATAPAGSFAGGIGGTSALGAPTGFGPALAGDPLGSVFSGVAPADTSIGSAAFGGPDLLGANAAALPSTDALPGTSGILGGESSGLGATGLTPGADLTGVTSDPFSGQFADPGAGQAANFGTGVNAGPFQPTNVITAEPAGGASIAPEGAIGTPNSVVSDAFSNLTPVNPNTVVQQGFSDLPSDALTNQSALNSDFSSIEQSNLNTSLTNPTLQTDLQNEAFMKFGTSGLPPTGDVLPPTGGPAVTPTQSLGFNDFAAANPNFTATPATFDTSGNLLGQAPGAGGSQVATETIPGVAPPSGSVSGPVSTAGAENAISAAGPGVSGAGGDVGGMAAATAGGSNNAFLASLGLTPATAATLGLGAAGLGLGLARSMQPLPDQAQLQQIAQQLASGSTQAQAQAQALINPLITGQLPPEQAAQVQQALQDGITATKARYAQLGMSGSTAETDQIANLIDRSVALAGSLEQQMASAGIQLGSQAQQDLNIEGTIFSTLMNAQINQDTALSNAIAQFAGQAAIATAI